MKVTVDLGNLTRAPRYVDVEIAEYRCEKCRREYGRIEAMSRCADCGGEVLETDPADEIRAALEGRDDGD